MLSISDELLRREISKQSGAAAPKFAPVVDLPAEKTKSSARSRRELLEEYLLTLLLKIPKDLTFVPNFPETIFLSENYRSIYVLLVIYLDGISFKTATFKIDEFVKTLPVELVSLIDRLYLSEIDDKLANLRAWKKEVETVVAELKKALIKASLEKLSAEIKTAQAFDKIESLEVLNRRFRDLSVKLKNL